MAIQIETVSNGVLFNGSLTDKQGWVLSPSSDQTKVVLTNRITGLSGSSDVTEVEVDGSTFADYDALVAALGDVLFKNGGGTGGSGVQSVTGDGVGGTASNPVLSFPTPADIGAATSAQGALADSSVQPSDITNVVESNQEGEVGILINNIIQVTQAQYDGLTPQAGTFYAIVG